MNTFYTIDPNPKESNTFGVGAPINYNMGKGVLGSYSNLSLQTPCKQGWKKPPCNPPKISNKQIVYQGTPLPLKNETVYSTIPSDSMFVFANSISSPACCPSTYSTDRGCVCTTDYQRKFVGERRGRNRDHDDYNF